MLSNSSNYIKIEELGSGKNAIATKCQLQGTNQFVALKECIENTSENIKALQQEAFILSLLNHPNIIHLYEYKNFTNTIFLIEELAEEGDLFNYVIKSSFSEIMTRTLFHQLIEGLSYCHENSIQHRDIKLDNLLLDKNFTLKIADFGFSTKMDNNQKCLLIRGTQYYIAPEIWQNVKSKGSQVDIFACGVVLFLMFTGFPPFEISKNEDSHYKYIINNKLNLFWKIQSKHQPEGKLTLEFQDLINGMLSYYPDNRLTISEIKNHPWYKGEIMSQADYISEFKAKKINLS